MESVLLRRTSEKPTNLYMECYSKQRYNAQQGLRATTNHGENVLIGFCGQGKQDENHGRCNIYAVYLRKPMHLSRNLDDLLVVPWASRRTGDVLV